MKKSPLRRKKPFSRGTPKKASTAPRKKSLKRKAKLRALNAVRVKKRRKSGKLKHRQYLATDTARIVELRSGGRCENVLTISAQRGSLTMVRCTKPATVHHHKSYKGYGGGEVPEQMLHICHECHMMIHGREWWKKGRR